MSQSENTQSAGVAPAPRQSLVSRLAGGGAIALGGYGFQQILRFASNLILARLVDPEVYGLMGIAISIFLWAGMMTDIGIATSIIRSPRSKEPVFLRTAWTLGILRNTLVWFLTIGAAVVIFAMAQAGRISDASILAHPSLPAVIIFTAIQIPIIGFTSTVKNLANRELRFGRLVSLEIAAQVCAMIVTITLAARGMGVWAFVIGMNVGALVGAIASHFVFPAPRMKFEIDRSAFKEIFGFGKWLIIASFFVFLVTRGDQVIFSWLMDKERFSLYAVAAIWIASAAAVFNVIVNRILFPAMSEVVRERPENLNSAYAKTRLILDGLAVAAAFGAFLFAQPVFNILYPGAYDGVGRYIGLMAPALLTVPYRLLPMAALVSGHSRGYTGAMVISGIVAIIGASVAYELFGETAGIVAFASAGFAANPLYWRLGARYMKVRPEIEIRMFVALAVLIFLIWRSGA